MIKESEIRSSDNSIGWVLHEPEYSPPIPHLVILCGDYSYGIIPYCGPGNALALWENEQRFLHELSEYLIHHGFYTLTLSLSHGDSLIPDDKMLTSVAGVNGILSTLRKLDHPVTWDPRQIICIGHGLGGHVHCMLASYGIRPAGFIFAGGVYTDYEVLLSQKYLPLIHNPDSYTGGEKRPDSDSEIIAKNLGVILHAIRKNRPHVTVQEYDSTVSLTLNQMLFTGDQIPRHMFRYITSPTLIIHGTNDYDVSVWNAASIEQAVRKNVVLPERVILADRDHWFKPVPPIPGDAIRERLNGECFKRETDPRFFQECVNYIYRILTKQPGFIRGVIPGAAQGKQQG